MLHLLVCTVSRSTEMDPHLMRRFIPKWIIATAYLRHGCLAFILLGLVQSLSLYLHCAPSDALYIDSSLYHTVCLNSLYILELSVIIHCALFSTRWINLPCLFTCCRILCISFLCSNKLWWWLRTSCYPFCTFGAGTQIIQSRAALQVTRRMQAQRQVFQFDTPWRRRRCCWSGSGEWVHRWRWRWKRCRYQLMHVSLCRCGAGSLYNSTCCRINKAHPAPFVLSFALSVTPSFWHHPPFFSLPSLRGLCLYQFVALATRGAFLSVPLICSMLQQSAGKLNEICYFLLFPSVLFLHALQCDWLQTCSLFFSDLLNM